ncbi:hypothetical protein QE152_g30936 [Popillia japonica]|uniref:Uncharacterized protein n=1 Tax=Popillia japonica TaxID=7064 RepID=A0AAW1JCR7_POPJA
MSGSDRPPPTSRHHLGAPLAPGEQPMEQRRHGLRTWMPPRRDHRAPNHPFQQHAAAADHSRHRSGEATPPPAGPRPAADPPSPPPGVQPSVRGRRNYYHHLHHETHHPAEG